MRRETAAEARARVAAADRREREAFPRRLARAMDDADVDAAELAGAVGVAEKTVRGWLEGARMPGMANLKAAARILGTETGTLLGRS